MFRRGTTFTKDMEERIIKYQVHNKSIKLNWLAQTFQISVLYVLNSDSLSPAYSVHLHQGWFKLLRGQHELLGPTIRTPQSQSPMAFKKIWS